MRIAIRTQTHGQAAASSGRARGSFFVGGGGGRLLERSKNEIGSRLGEQTRRRDDEDA
jgi:hypothetical protein